MKRILFIILISIFLSCNLFKSTNELLTNKEWILYQKFESELSKDSKMIFYKKSQKYLTFYFESIAKSNAGILSVSEENNKRYGKGAWELNDLNKKKLFIDNVEFNIMKLKIDEFELSRLNSNNKYETLYFYTIDNKKWMDDEIVDEMNKQK